MRNIKKEWGSISRQVGARYENGRFTNRSPSVCAENVHWWSQEGTPDAEMKDLFFGLSGTKDLV